MSIAEVVPLTDRPSVTSAPRAPERIRRLAATATAIFALILGGLLLSAPSAAAATPNCHGTSYVWSYAGGCDGNFTAGKDRLVLQCRVQNSNYYWTQYGAWHNRYADWAEWRQCGGQTYIWHAWFEHA